MAHDVIDYEAVLSDLEAKKSALDAAIAALRHAVNLGAQVAIGGSSGTVASRPVDPLDIPSDAFFGMSITDAVKKYLAMVKRKQTIKEIADALDRGGLPHSSTNFIGTVRAMVNLQAKTDPELVRVGPGNWGLSAWYGNRRPKELTTKSRGRRERRAPSKRPRERQAAAHTAPSAEKPALTIVQQAEHILRDTGALSIDSLVEQIERRFDRKVSRQTLIGILAEKVRKQQTFARPAPNTYGLLSGTTLH